MRLLLLTVLHQQTCDMWNSHTGCNIYKIRRLGGNQLKKSALSCKKTNIRKIKYHMHVIKIQKKLYLCGRHLKKLKTSPLSSHLLHYFHLVTSHKNLKYSGFIRQFKNLNCVYGLQHVHICAAMSREK
jgi:hypothetical protein